VADQAIGPGPQPLSTGAKMAVWKKKQALSLLWLLLALISACAGPHLAEAPETYYVTAVVSYLRECPEYNCQVVAELYRGDAVKLLVRNGKDWWQLYSERTGRTGWLQSTLLSHSPLAITEAYYVRENVTLRDCPGNDCPGHKLLLRGEEVQKIIDNGKGWWRVLAAKDKSLGWVLAKLVSATPESVAGPPPPEKKGSWFVGPETLELHALPLGDSQVVKVVNRNDQVEKLSEPGGQWLKVRHPKSGAEGWTKTSYLKDAPVVAEEAPPKRKKAKKKVAAQKSKEEAPPKSPVLKPEPM
jgi:uncharacterized protein YgiM (DUF1202 family)